jgi:hypothetical protein
MRIAIFLLFFFFTIQVMAQNKQFVENINWLGKKVELHTILNRTKQSSCTFLASNDSIRAYVFTGPLKLMRQFSVPRRLNANLLGGFMRDSSVYMFTERAANDELYCLAMNVITGTVRETVIPFDPENEKTVTHISAGNHFLYVTASNKKNELIVYDFANERAGAPLRYQFSDEQWKELTRPGFLTRNVRLIKIEHDGDLNLDNLAKKNKLYLNNESVMLVMNNHLDSTRIISFDLKQQNVRSWVIAHNPGSASSKNISYSDNSFLFRNKLYYVRATSDSLQVQIVDAYTGAVSRSFSTASNKEISWKNTPIIDEEDGGSQKGVRNRENTKQLLRKMIKDTAVIMVRPYGNDQIEVVVGAYARKTAYMSNGAAGAAGAALGAAAVGAYAGPQYISPAMSSGGFYRSTWTKSMHFKMLLDADYSNIPGEPASSMAERIERYTANLRIPPDQENIFVTNGQYYYAYYDKGERRLVVLKF